MKYLLLTICLFLTGCVAFIPKKATVIDESVVRDHLEHYTLEPGTVEYFGTNIYSARHIYGRAWLGNTLGYFVIIIDPDTNRIETHWSENGEFPDLDRRLFLDTLPRA